MLWQHILLQSAIGFLTVLYCLGLTPAKDVPKCEVWDVLIDFDVRYELCSPKDVYASWTSEVQWARRAYGTAKENNYPPLSMLLALPCKEVVREQIAFAGAYHLNGSGAITPDEYRALVEPWELLSYAQIPNWSIHRRQWLAKLRSKIGYAAFYAGVIPPAVPLWKFKEVRDEDSVSDPAVRRALRLLRSEQSPR